MSWAFKTGSVFGDKVHFIGFRVKCGLCKQSNRNFAGRFAVKLTWRLAVPAPITAVVAVDGKLLSW